MLGHHWSSQLESSQQKTLNHVNHMDVDLDCAYGKGVNDKHARHQRDPRPSQERKHVSAGQRLHLSMEASSWLVALRTLCVSTYGSRSIHEFLK